MTTFLWATKILGTAECYWKLSIKFAINWEFLKTEGSVRKIIFLGLKINTENQTVTIPQETLLDI
jgi:hypothetical protein